MGKPYGFTKDEWIQKLQRASTEKGNLLFVAEEEGRLAGFAWVHTHGAFLAAPYLRFIAVDPSFQGRGVGTLLLKEFEEQTRNRKKDWFLLVSEFNTGAQQFYERHGYQRVGALPGFAKEGITEVIMVKKHEGRTSCMHNGSRNIPRLSTCFLLKTQNPDRISNLYKLLT